MFVMFKQQCDHWKDQTYPSPWSSNVKVYDSSHVYAFTTGPNKYSCNTYIMYMAKFWIQCDENIIYFFDIYSRMYLFIVNFHLHSPSMRIDMFILVTLVTIATKIKST